MMQPYPFFGFPNFRRYYHYPYHPNVVHNSDSSYANKNTINPAPKQKNYNHFDYNPKLNPSSQKNHSSSNVENSSSQEEEQFFDFFGIKLAFDDLLILALLFFLYQEEAKDPYLYISLILLLLS